MKEKDIRERIQTFLKETVRYVVVPASMGIGLALVGSVGCGSSESSDGKDGGAITITSVTTGTETGAVALYSAPMGTDTGSAVTKTDTSLATGVMKYMAVMPDAGQPQPEYMAPLPTNTKTDTATVVAVYSAPLTGIKTGTGTGSAATATKTGVGTNPVALYMAVMPDAGTVEKYSAPIPRDAGQPQPDYMAPLPTSTATSTKTNIGPIPLYAAPMTGRETATKTNTSAGTNPVLRYMAVQPTEGATATKTDFGVGTGMMPIYAAPVPGELTGGK